MAYECRLKQVLPKPILSIRGKTSMAELSKTIGSYLGEVSAFIEKSGRTPAGPPFTRYHSTDNPDALDLEAGLPLESPLRGEGRILAGSLPGGEVVSTDHPGPYEGLPKAGEALDRWCEEHGRRAAGPNWEVYWTDPGREPDPAKWRTEVLKPLEPAR